MDNLPKAEIAKVKKVKNQKNEDEILRKENVVAVGIGRKIVDGKLTDRPALITFVKCKKDECDLAEKDIVPATVDGIETDVVEIGEPVIENAENKLVEEDADTMQRTLPGNELTSRIRPLKGGWSIGHPDITAGTAGAVVFNNDETLPGRYYILSNNHVIANSNAAKEGDPILQPGAVDGGKRGDDQVAVLSKFIPIDLTPDVPLEEQNNIVDAAIAEGSLQELDREIYWNGYVKGWVKKEDVEVGTRVKKTGRTTGYTAGTIISVDTTVDVNFGRGRTARFRDQIFTTNMSEGGDSGSLVTDMENRAVGLLFAGSSEITILNQIENVRELLKIEFV
ncbi:hypothetical protein [Evansella clarkii]|uniref:hypothetical protein n=1 Tax=Evansella clarkii TaxID=79879 RepID=UPI0009978232|nr:hypothetical protein [Evansella clarkii]